MGLRYSGFFSYVKLVFNDKFCGLLLGLAKLGVWLGHNVERLGNLQEIVDKFLVKVSGSHELWNPLDILWDIQSDAYFTVVGSIWI